MLFYNSKVQSITEGSCFNVFIVDKNDVVITYPLKNEILGGCTRKRILKILEENGKKFEERCYSKEELYNAKEVFISGALKVNSVINVDGKQIANGKVGEMTKWVKQKYTQVASQSATGKALYYSINQEKYLRQFLTMVISPWTTTLPNRL